MWDDDANAIDENEILEDASEEIRVGANEYEVNDDLVDDDLVDDDLVDDDLVDDDLVDNDLKNVDEPLNAPPNSNDSTTTFTGNSGNIMPAVNAMPGTCNYVCTYVKAEYSWNTLCAVE